MDVAQDAPQTIILTEDESSMYLQATTQQAWSLVGQPPTIRVDPSRTKTNFYGTLMSWTKTPSEVVNHRVLGRVTPPSDNQGAAR